MDRPVAIELLAPARDADIAIEAIRHGADAVYIGGASHGARAAAGNGVADIARAVDYAHRFGARVYVTLNTLVYDNELGEVERLIRDLYNIGVDALIVQDLGILRMDIPPIALHASTQCDIRTPEKARFLQDMGFSQLVLPRELGLDEIRQMREATSVPLEAFVHGALCVSYSGDCQASLLTTGRSANRGECAQLCRLPYDLYDRDGNRLLQVKHLLSLRDMNRSAHLASMMDAGVSSFKIEGRLKDAAYVKNITAFYRQRLDAIIDGSAGRYVRSSYGTVTPAFVPAPEKSFNRGFTDYFLRGTNPRVASVDTPKWVGERIGAVEACSGVKIRVRTDKVLNNGDGIGYFNERREFNGFRVNRAEGNILYAARPVDLPRGTVLYRNHDHNYDAMMGGVTATREIGVAMTLRALPWGIALEAADVRGNKVSASAQCELSEARTPQLEPRRRTLGKLGGTIYRLDEIDDRVGDCFIPASVLTDLRRRVVELLDGAQRTGYRFDYRKPEIAGTMAPMRVLTYHDNVANRLAASAYSDHGASGARALEVEGKPAGDTVVMTTRYCVRREFGCCLKTADGSKWRGPLMLRADGFDLRLDFDCANCRMKVVYPAKT